MRLIHTLAISGLFLMGCHDADHKTTLNEKEPSQSRTTVASPQLASTQTDPMESTVCSMTPQKYESLHPGVLHISDDVKQPVLVKRAEMDLSRLKKTKLALGVTIIMAVITDDGSVKDPCIIRAYQPDYDIAVLQAVKQWQYQPASKGGKPVAVFFTVTSNPEF